RPRDAFALLLPACGEKVGMRGRALAIGRPLVLSSPPGLTRWSMLTCCDTNVAVMLNEPALRMDCRVKPSNDEGQHRPPDALMRPSLSHHDDARNRFAFPT